jgi:prepilin peptidase CpaA
MSQTFALPAAIVLGASCVVALTDVWRFKVYNVLVFPLLVSGLIYHTAVGGASGLTLSITGMLFGFVLLIFPYASGMMGAGDVKFVAAIGAWLGWQAMFFILLIGFMATGVYAVVVMVYHGGFRSAWTNLQIAFSRLALIGRHLGAGDDVESVQAMAAKDDRRRRLIPFSAMVAVGVAATYAWSLWFQ